MQIFIIDKRKRKKSTPNLWGLHGFDKYCMRLNEFATQTKMPDQLRIDSLKTTKDRAAQAIAAERQRQRVDKAQKKLSAVQHPQIKPVTPKL
jgi:hypothetical protein